jgi:hypothetical protein
MTTNFTNPLVALVEVAEPFPIVYGWTHDTPQHYDLREIALHLLTSKEYLHCGPWRSQDWWNDLEEEGNEFMRRAPGEPKYFLSYDIELVTWRWITTLASGEPLEWPDSASRIRRG